MRIDVTNKDGPLFKLLKDNGYDVLLDVEAVDGGTTNLEVLRSLLDANGYAASGPYGGPAVESRSVAKALLKPGGPLPSEENLRELASDYLNISYRLEDLKASIRAALDAS